jgi:integrase
MPRLCLPPAEWPDPERSAWERALRPRQGLYDEVGAASERRRRAVANVAEAIGHWLAFLAAQGWLEPVETPLARVTPARLDAFVASQQARGNSARTIAGRLGGLASGLRWMQPGCDVGFIRRPGGVPVARALGVQVRPVETIDSLDLFARAAALSDPAVARLPDRSARAEVRDAALLGLLALFAPRLGEVAALRLGEHLLEEGGTLRLVLPGIITKTGRHRGFPLPEPLAALIRRYLDAVRPAWEPAGGAPELWLGGRRRPLSLKVIQEIVAKRTEAWTGRRRRPTWFRKCLTTTSAMRGADFAFDTALVMGHGPLVALRHYNMATAISAADRHQERLRRLRAETRAAAVRFYRARRRAGGRSVEGR